MKLLNIIKTILTALLLLCIPQSACSQNVIQMERSGGVYKIPCEVNGLRLKMILDTGASKVTLSREIASMMLENGYLYEEDVIGSSQAQVADGRIIDNIVVNIRDLKIGSKSLKNVHAWVSESQSAPLLLGQSALRQLGTYRIEGDRLCFEQDNIGMHNPSDQQSSQLGTSTLGDYTSKTLTDNEINVLIKKRKSQKLIAIMNRQRIIIKNYIQITPYPYIV